VAANEIWSMDFVSGALFDGWRLRALTGVDAFTREALAIDVDQGIKGEQEDARAKSEAWWRNYNESRPHTSLGWLTPVEYAAAAAKIAAE